MLKVRIFLMVGLINFLGSIWNKFSIFGKTFRLLLIQYFIAIIFFSIIMVENKSNESLFQFVALGK